MDISIIIISYNVRDYLLECLESLYSGSYKNFEVIVVDNASKDDSVNAVRLRYPQCIIIENKNNTGFPAANNQGFKIAKGNYIFMLNPDAFLYQDTLQNLFDYMEKNPDTDIAAPQLFNSDGSLQLSVWRFPTIGSIFSEMFYLKFFLNKKNYNDLDKSKPFEADSFSGAAIMFRRSVIDKIGMLDESLFWIEDVDFCYRAKQAGLKLVYFPDAKAVHHISKSAKSNYKISVSNQVFNKIKFFKKHKGAMQYLIIVLLSFIYVLLKLLLFLILSPFSRIYFSKAKAYAYTLPRVFNPPKSILK
jgi:N-acetylglucosaminyl-diphospho-decaprenol L-rhamnosyltransferase